MNSKTNFDNLIIDRVVSAWFENSEHNVLAVLDQLSNLTINIGSETKDKTDAQGALISRKYKAKSVEVSAENAIFSMNLNAMQSGSTVKKDGEVELPRIIQFNKAKTITLPEIPINGTLLVYGTSANGLVDVDKQYLPGAKAGVNMYTYTEKDGKAIIELPTNATDTVQLKYIYRVKAGSKAIRIEHDAVSVPKVCMATFEVLCSDVCDAETSYLMYIVFPRFQMKPEFDWNLDTESSQPLKADCFKDYCSKNQLLFYVAIADEREFSQGDVPYNPDQPDQPDLPVIDSGIADSLSQLDLELGEQFSTHGYHEIGDGGAADYVVEETKKLGGIQLANGLYANPKLKNSVSVKVLGAYGDGVHDDTNAINEGVNSGLTIVEIPNGDYLCSSAITLTTHDSNIMGEANSRLLTNDFFGPNARSFLDVQESHDVRIDGIQFICNAISYPNYSSQIAIGNSQHIEFANCTFEIPALANVKDVHYQNIDLMTGIQYISVSDCKFANAMDSTPKGNFDIYEPVDGSNLGIFFDNNVRLVDGTYETFDLMSVI